MKVESESDQNRKFIRWYLPLCAVLFAVMTAGILFVYLRAGFDPLIGFGLAHEDAYYFRDASGFHIYYGGKTIDMQTNLLGDVQMGQCYHLSLNVDLITKTVIVQNEPTLQSFCGLP